MEEYSNDSLSSTHLEKEIHDEEKNDEPKMSKSKLKKQLKREKWLAIKQEKRRASKLKRKQRLAEMRKNGEDIGPSRKKLKTNTMKNSSCKIRVVIDLSFDDYMAEKAVNSLSCQIQHSYSSNRRAANPMQLYLCSLGGKAKQRLDSIGDYKGWDIHKESKTYEELFPKESLVYLSSESPNVLTTLSEDKVYIIGGLVDHNKHKGLCHKLAEEKGIAHAQLPISEYLNMKARKVLAINHVFCILLKYTQCGSWEEAFMSEMPQRMNAHLKEEDCPVLQNTENSTDESETQSKDLSSSQDAAELKNCVPESTKTDPVGDLGDSCKDDTNNAMSPTGTEVGSTTKEIDSVSLSGVDCLPSRTDVQSTEN